MRIEVEHDGRCLCGELTFEASALAWQNPSPRDAAVDGTWHVRASIAIAPGVAQHVVGLTDTAMALVPPRAVKPLAAHIVQDLVKAAFYNDATLGNGVPGITVGAPWWSTTGMLAPTHATRYRRGGTGPYFCELRAEPEDWMQDWPLEVADEGKLEPAIACYERAVGEEDRFDLMWFILFSFEMSLLSGRGAIDSPVLSWIEATMGRDFAVHGHTVRYWACLADVGFDGRCTIDAGWPVLTTLARRVFERSVVPLPISSA